MLAACAEGLACFLKLRLLNLDHHFQIQEHTFFAIVKLTILLRTRNSQNELWKFEERARQGDEIVIVDHASSDRTLDIAAKMGAKIVPYSREVFSYGAALNVGIPVCTNDWVLVASPHFEPWNDRFWSRLVQDLGDLPVDVVACQAPIFLGRRTNHPKQGITFTGSADLGDVPWRLYGNTCCAYRRQWLDRFPFDEQLLTAEDVEWCYRVVQAGYRICVDHRVPVVYRNRAPIGRYWRRGRTDFPALSMIYQREIRPAWSEIFVAFIKEGLLFILGRIPFWLWIRLVVKRTAELTLLFR